MVGMIDIVAGEELAPGNDVRGEGGEFHSWWLVVPERCPGMNTKLSKTTFGMSNIHVHFM